MWKKPATNAAGKPIKDVNGQVVGLRDFMAKERASPSHEIFTSQRAKGLEEKYLSAMLLALAAEWRKMLAHGIEGKLRPECRTPAMKETMDQVPHHTMLSERTLGSAKQVAAVMQTGSQAAKAARVNARLSNFWAQWDKMTAEEKVVVDSLVSKFQLKLRAHDKKVQQMHDAEAAERALRHEKEVCREAARKWANSLVHMRVKNWTVAEVDRKLKGKNLVTGADSQLRNLNEQLDALVDGYG